ncbi:MAG: peroxidase [Rhodobacteraceae bacterium]|nr:peroxidase [Paracoccaceae bacterium]
MPFLPSLPETAHLSDLLKLFPTGIRPLMEYIDILLRGESDLTIGERELIATYTSGLNACTFCFGSHRSYAELFGIDASLIDALVDDLNTAPVDAKLRPLLAYVAKLNTLPTRLVEADAKAVFDAGWSEAALFDAVKICGLFNLMNRMIEGTGVNYDYANHPQARPGADGDISKHRNSYIGYADRLGL